MLLRSSVRPLLTEGLPPPSPPRAPAPVSPRPPTLPVEVVPLASVPAPPATILPPLPRSGIPAAVGIRPPAHTVSRVEAIHAPPALACTLFETLDCGQFSIAQVQETLEHLTLARADMAAHLLAWIRNAVAQPDADPSAILASLQARLQQMT